MAASETGARSEALWSQAIEDENWDEAKRIAQTAGLIEGFETSVDAESGELSVKPIVMSEQDIQEIEERAKQRRILNSYAIDHHTDSRFPASLDCIDKRSMPFYE